MNKLQFTFTVRNITDVKTNVLCITAIGTLNGQVYAVPDEYQPVTFHKEIVKLAAFNKVKNSLTRRPVTFHKEIVKLPAFNKVKNSLTRRHQTRKVWINVTEELAKIYLDEGENLQIVKNSLTRRHQTRKVWINVTEELAKIYLDEGENLQIELAKIYLDEGENLQIGDFYLEEITDKPEDKPQTTNVSEQPLIKMLEKLLGKNQVEKGPCETCKNRGKEKIEEIWDKFEIVQTEIENLDSSEVDSHAEYREEFEENYYKAVGKARQIIDNSERNAEQLTNQNAGSNNNTSIATTDVYDRVYTKLHLPTLNLPKFNGDTRNGYYLKIHFRRQFITIQR
ncbi:hypothetical protein QE152_g37366 [Popillia japonica]|uniref:Uncharacterized protein n=1 Tax=Popillia japonica TaxID=7064 RepID=A0AAW1IAZ7_POPJA